MYAFVLILVVIIIYLWYTECPCGCKCKGTLCNPITGCHNCKCRNCRAHAELTLSRIELPPEQPTVANIEVNTAPKVEFDYRYGPRLVSQTKVSVEGVNAWAREGFEPTSRKRINKTRRVYLHYTNWCGYCKKMKPVWERVKETLSTSGVEFIEVDEDVAKTPGINGYPTIEMLDEYGYRRLYGGQIDYAQLRDWVASAN